MKRIDDVEGTLREESERALERVDVGVGVLARVQLDVGEPAVVIDHAVRVVDAHPAVQVLGAWVADDAVSCPGTLRRGELFDVQCSRHDRALGDALPLEPD
jgi:hypothetical protein